MVEHRPERPGLRCGHDLEVADARPATRAPVDERLGPVGEVCPVQALESDPHGLGRALVHRVAQAAPVGRRPDPPLLREHQVAGRGDERAHPLEISLTTQRSPTLPVFREDAVEDELRGDRGVVEARQEERAMAAHPGVADHQVLDRRPLGVPEVERAGDVRWRLDDREWRQVRIGGGTRPVGGEHVRGEPALVDRALDIVRRIGLRKVRHRSVLAKQKPRSSSGRTGRGTTCWFGARCGPLIAVRSGPGALATRYRASPVTARERPSRRRARAARTVPRSLRGRPSLLFPVIAVRAGV